MFDRIKKILSDRREEKRLERNKFLSDSLTLGFDKVDFPLIIQDGFDLAAISSLDDFLSDPDLYFHEFDESTKLIDAQGRLFTWGHNSRLKSNFPDKFIKQLTIDELRDIIREYVKDFKKKPGLGEERTTRELIEKLIGYS